MFTKIIVSGCIYREFGRSLFCWPWQGDGWPWGGGTFAFKMVVHFVAMETLHICNLDL